MLDGKRYVGCKGKIRFPVVAFLVPTEVGRAQKRDRMVGVIRWLVLR